MIIGLQRKLDNGKSATGLLTVGTSVFYTLEDTGKLGYGRDCGIPPGEYQVVWAMSPSKKKKTLRLLSVPGRDGILIHSGNTVDDCRGCILVGLKSMGQDMIGDSRLAVAMLEEILVPILKHEEVYIQVKAVP